MVLWPLCMAIVAIIGLPVFWDSDMLNNIEGPSLYVILHLIKAVLNLYS